MLHNKTLKELAQGLKTKQYSSMELVSHFLKRIKSVDVEFNSFITVTEETAYKQAALADKKIAQKTAKLSYSSDSSKASSSSESFSSTKAVEATDLTGIPIAHKDVFYTQGIKTSCASKMLDKFIPTYNAAVVERLEQAGCVLLGKTNMDEFAMGSSTEYSYYGATKNPWDLVRSSGGSSGGSAAAVAARLIPAATGSDTGGSIRQPAAFCGVTGLRPTYGLVSHYGMIPFAQSLDQAGILAVNAEDTALLLNFMAGFDRRDTNSFEVTIPDYSVTLGDSLQGLKIGVPQEYFGDDLSPEVACAVEAAMNVFQKLGAVLVAIKLPNLNLSIPTYHIIASAEGAVSLAGYGRAMHENGSAGVADAGQVASKDKEEDYDSYVRVRSLNFGAEVKRRIMMGTYVLAKDLHENFYLQAQKVRNLIKNDFDRAFTEVDVIISPTTPAPAFKIGEKVDDPVNMYLSDMYTAPSSLCGLPSISIPVGFAFAMPIGVQLIGRYFNEAKLLNIAHQYQQMTRWHRETPRNF